MHDLSLYLLELLENSVRAQADRIAVGISIDHSSDRISLTVDDDGRGLTTEPEQVLDPFYTTKRDKKTGLGLSLLRAEAEAAQGCLTMGASEQLGGVRVEVDMRLSHIDRPPVGDLATSIMVAALTNPEIEFTVTLTGDEFEPPLVRATLEEARPQLMQTAERLDGRLAASSAQITQEKHRRVPSPGKRR